MTDELLKSNLHYDELNKIRILDPLVTSPTIELKENCKEYAENLYESKACKFNFTFEFLSTATEVKDFETIIGMVIGLLKKLSEDVEKKKMAAIGITNLLKTMAKHKESDQMKLQAAINEKTLEMEHLDAEYDSLQLLELTQQETIEYLTELH